MISIYFISINDISSEKNDMYLVISKSYLNDIYLFYIYKWYLFREKWYVFSDI